MVSPANVSTHLNRLDCPDNTDLGATDEFLDILGRSYPRAAPGRLVEVRSDPATGLLKVKATATEAGGELVIWTPTASDDAHPINVFGLTDVVEHEVDGGRIITATVTEAGIYALWIGPADEDLSAPTEPTEPTDGPPPAAPVAGDPSYTG